MRKKASTLRIGIYAGNERSVKATRDKISGCLRYASRRDNWEVQLFDESSWMSMTAAEPDYKSLDGIILLSQTPLKPSLEKVKSRCISVDSASSDATTPSISIDNRAIAKAGVDFFVRRGFRTLAFVGSESRVASLHVHSQARERSFRTAAENSGVDIALHRITDSSESSWNSALERLAAFIANLPKPCGLMACADETAKMVLDACRLAHVRVPDQVSILGVDNETDICENVQPTLSSILPDFERCGFLAARLLDRLLLYGNLSKARPYVYGIARLIERASTLDLRGGGRLVSSASDIIRRKALSGLRVADIARELHVSTRLFQLRFLEIRGHSAQDEIIAIRLEEVQRLVQQTQIPLSEIAMRCGWKSPTALQTLFRRRFGHSMTYFRKMACKPAS